MEYKTISYPLVTLFRFSKPSLSLIHQLFVSLSSFVTGKPCYSPENQGFLRRKASASRRKTAGPSLIVFLRFPFGFQWFGLRRLRISEFEPVRSRSRRFKRMWRAWFPLQAWCWFFDGWNRDLGFGCWDSDSVYGCFGFCAQPSDEDGGIYRRPSEWDGMWFMFLVLALAFSPISCLFLFSEFSVRNFVNSFSSVSLFRSWTLFSFWAVS